MTVIRLTAAMTLVLICMTSWAGEEPAPQEKPSLSATQTMKVSAMVESVNYETREVTLRDASGELIEFVAGDEIVNLAQMKSGDVVIAEMTEGLYIDVLEDQGTEPSESEFTVMGSAEEGQKPGMSAFDSQVVTATVEAIDLETNTFQLKWPDGFVGEYVAENPENLEKAAVGDLVVITRTVNLDISVEETE